MKKIMCDLSDGVWISGVITKMFGYKKVRVLSDFCWIVGIDD